jgi:hypothetical protein
VSHPPGTIVIPGGEFLRFGGFFSSMLAVKRPDGSHVHLDQSVSIVENLNNCIRAQPDSSEWVWFQADDHIFPDDALMRLLDRDVDCVVPLILRRSPPFVPVIYKDFIPGRGYMPFGLHQLPEKGLIEVHAAGSAGMLVRRTLLDKIGDPWFEYEAGTKLNEDLTFCRKIRDHAKIYCDVEVVFGHRATFTAVPHFENGRWGVGLRMGAATNGKSNTIVVHPTEIKEH